MRFHLNLYIKMEGITHEMEQNEELFGINAGFCHSFGRLQQPGSNQAPTSGSGAEAAKSTGSVTPGTGGTAVGFIFVGARDDYGYNQAAYLGSEAVQKAFPDLKVLRAENVPETAEAERVMEQMIQEGAKIIFPTSYGHLDPALNVAKRHPEVAFFHQGGLKTADNLGTYFGTIWERFILPALQRAKCPKQGNWVISFPFRFLRCC